MHCKSDRMERAWRHWLYVSRTCLKVNVRQNVERHLFVSDKSRLYIMVLTKKKLTPSHAPNGPSNNE